MNEPKRKNSAAQKGPLGITSALMPKIGAGLNPLFLPSKIKFPGIFEKGAFATAKPPLATNQLGKTILGLSAKVNSVFSPMKFNWDGLADTMKKFREAMAAHERELPEVLSFMVEHSWYPDFDFAISDMRELEEPAKNKNLQAFESILIDHYKARKKSLEEELIADYPERRTALSAAFEAFDNGKYILAIPVFLAQADGISCSILQAKHFFTFGSSEKPAKDLHAAEVSSYVQIFLEPLMKRGKLRTSTNRLNNPAFEFNRHAVMHGLVSDYGNEVNALKAISLLAYLHSLVSHQ